MFCRKCGNKLEEKDLFCPDCGTKVMRAPKSEPIPQPQELQSDGFKGLIFEEEKELPLNIIQKEEEEASDLAVKAPEEKEEPAEDTDIDVTVEEKKAETEEPEEMSASAPLPLFADDEPTASPLEVKENETEEVKENSFEESEDIPELDGEEKVTFLDDSYNVYSGSNPDVASQEITYSIENGNSSAEAEDSFSKTGDFPKAEQHYAYQPVPSQVENYGYQPENAENPVAPLQPEESRKKNNGAMWVIIICISVIVIALGVSCAVILTQYDSFSDFFASFSESVKEEMTSEETDNTDIAEEKTTASEETLTLPDLFVTEAESGTDTTAEPTSAPIAYDGTCGVKVMYDYDEANKQLKIFGTGEMQSYEKTSAPWADYDVTTVVIEEGVTSVTPGAFAALSPESISIPASLTNFDATAVSRFGAINVSPLNKVYMSSNGALFDKTQSILILYPNMSESTSYVVPEGVTMIGRYAFFNAKNLKVLAMSSTVVFIDEYAFSDCTGIISMDIPATVKEIRRCVFYGWQANQKIRIVSTETRIVDSWNDGCNAEITVG